jgi:hypothetical protein
MSLWTLSSDIHTGGSDVGVSEPFLDLRAFGVATEGIGGGRCTQRMGADLEAQRQRVAAHEFVDTVGGDAIVETAGAVVANGSEQGAFGVRSVSSFV